MDQIVIGLDQNYLINLEGALFNKEVPNINLWHSLLEKFVDLIFKKKKVICPYSEFTEREALTGFHRVPVLKELSKVLSKGWDFKYWSSNLILQLVCSLLTLFDKPCPYDIDLSIGKLEYYRIYLESGNQYENIKICKWEDLLFFVEEYAKHYQLQLPDVEQENLKNELAVIMQHVMKDKKAPYEIHAASLIFEFLRSDRPFYSIMGSWIRQMRPDIYNTEKCSKIKWVTYLKCYPPENIPSIILNNELRLIGVDLTQADDEFIGALKNKMNYEIPFIKVWATLWEYLQENPGCFSKSIKTASWDFFRASAMIPACDLYCTDEEMKNALYASNLAKYFDVMVFDATKKSLCDLNNKLDSFA